MAGEDERGGSRGDLKVKRLFHLSECLTTKNTSDYFILPSATMSGYATLRPSGENEADVNLKKRTRVTTINYPCGKNERGGSA